MPNGFGTTLTRHIMNTQAGIPEATGMFSGLMMNIATAAKVVAREVNKAGLVDVLGLTGEQNVQGEKVQKLDEYANRIFIRSLSRSGHFCIIASEENADPIVVPDAFRPGPYVVSIDPMDGSSNIDANVSIGTIFSVHRKISEDPKGTIEDLLQPGRQQVAAGYIIYGSSTMLVYSAGRGVHGFTLDPSLGEFLLAHDDMRIPEQGRIYSVNGGNYHFWSKGVQAYVDHLKEVDPASRRPYSSRYIGSMVADVHRTLVYGGIFMYPADSKNARKATGKIRLLYEASPLSYLIEQAGGRAVTGRERILDIVPDRLHQRVPVFMGSPRDVDQLVQFIEEHDGEPK
jgi:fructose-1,6-bisphosphatase I